MYDTSLYATFNYGYFYSIKFTFLRPSKAIVNCHIAQWVSALNLAKICSCSDKNMYGAITIA